MITIIGDIHCFLFSIFAAVKFGRMSKKQREKVEDEVRYHKEFNSQHNGGASTGPSGVTAVGPVPGAAAASRSHSGASGSSPDTTGSVFDPQPSSTDHM